ncbi:MAG TPA: ABC transporter permease [Candidatus Paceibacterota bacterium]|nr:ABC transporter permease [Candidatus Paceibacterota bacterium]
MTTKNLYRETVAALLSNKSRSGLTVLGIVIGIMSVIVMLAVGNGTSSSIQSSIQGLGSNLLTVSAGAAKGPGSQVSGSAGSAQSLTVADATAIQDHVSGVENVSPEVSSNQQIVAANANSNSSIYGVQSVYATVHNVDMQEGSFISDKNNLSLARVVVLGPTLSQDLFGVGAEAIGQTVRIDNLQFTVVGVTKAKGGSGFTNPDSAAYIPLSTAQEMITGNQYVSTISVEAASASDSQSVEDGITSLLLKRHNITDSTKADFNIQSQASLSSTLSSITTILTYLLAAIASISLIVGGIGIMNMMLTTVTERTKEIGLRKAIGAKKRDISMQFLAEAVALTMVGGVIGVVLGYLIAYVITLTGILTATVTTSSVLLAVGVSAGIGIVFGYFPARRAANLNPIEALRYE